MTVPQVDRGVFLHCPCHPECDQQLVWDGNKTVGEVDVFPNPRFLSVGLPFCRFYGSMSSPAGGGLRRSAAALDGRSPGPPLPSLSTPSYYGGPVSSPRADAPRR